MMNKEQFDNILLERLDRIKSTLYSKAEEYSTDKDKLHNFNRASVINQESREKALWGMATKHLVSVLDIIHNTNKGTYPTKEVVDEKFGDLINYLILCEISLKEDIK